MKAKNRNGWVPSEGMQARLKRAFVIGCKTTAESVGSNSTKQDAVLDKLAVARDEFGGRRFDAWLAGASAEQAAAWQERKDGK